jgi:UDP-glucose 4-epimerase
MEYAKSKPIKKIVYAASSSCYGADPAIPTSEDNVIKCEYPYALTKFQGEEIVQHFGKLFDIPHISLRLFNVYGLRSRTHGAYGAALGVFLKQKLSKKPFTVVGTGNQKRDFLNISDLFEAFHKASISKYNYEIFILGSSKPNSINYLASLISNNKIYIPWRQGEPFKTDANINKIKKYLKWKPEVSLKSGIEIVKNNIYYWKNAPLWTKKKIYLATKLWNKCLKKKKY